MNLLEPTSEGPHTLEVRNTGTKNASSSGFKVRYKTLATPASARLYDLQTMAYGYDAAVRLKTANTYPGVNTAATPTKSYAYDYDVAGNRTQQVVTPGGSTNYTYDAANRLTSDGVNSYTYDNAGRMTGDGVNTYAWDRANRLLSQAGVSNLYNGLGQRVQQTVGANVTQYVLDVQPGLWEVLAATTGATTTRYVHGLRGLHAQEDNAGVWTWPVEDGLGSVYGVVNNSLVPQESRQYSPVGEPTQVSGSSQTVYGFTGEPTDGGVGLVYLRARYMNPVIGQFISLDTLETANRYAYADDDPINRVDPSGLFGFCDRPGNCGRPSFSSGARSGGSTSRPSASTGSRPGPRPSTSGSSGSRPASRPSTSGGSASRPGPRPNTSGGSGGRPGSRPGASGSSRPGSAASVSKAGQSKPGQHSTNDKTTASRTTASKDKPQNGSKLARRSNDLPCQPLLVISSITGANGSAVSNKPTCPPGLLVFNVLNSAATSATQLLQIAGILLGVSSQTVTMPDQECDESLRLDLQSEIGWACAKDRSCTSANLSCSEITLRITAGIQCVDARKRMKEKCFPNSTSHDGEIAAADRVLERCWTEYDRRCSS